MSRDPNLPVSDSLVSEFGKEIKPFRDRDEFACFDKEVPFINKTIDVLDDVSVHANGLSLHVATKRIHLTPKVRFRCEATGGCKNAELADLLFILTFVRGSQVVARRSILSQAKHASDDDYKTLRQWTPDPYQYYLLYYSKEFMPVKPFIFKSYKFPKRRSSLRTYSFASDFWLPFFHSADGMAEIVGPDKNKKTNYKYDRTDNPPSGYQSMTGYLKQFVRGHYGARFTKRSSLGQFYRDLFKSTKKFKRSKSPNWLIQKNDIKFTDGGEPFDDPPETPPEEVEQDDGMGVVNIVVGTGSKMDTDSPAENFFLGEDQPTLSDI